MLQMSCNDLRRELDLSLLLLLIPSQDQKSRQAEFTAKVIAKMVAMTFAVNSTCCYLCREKQAQRQQQKQKHKHDQPSSSHPSDGKMIRLSVSCLWTRHVSFSLGAFTRSRNNEKTTDNANQIMPVIGQKPLHFFVFFVFFWILEGPGASRRQLRKSTPKKKQTIISASPFQ